MTTPEKTLISRLVDGAFGLLVAALALYAAAELVTAVWRVLAVVALVVVTVGVAALWWQRRGW